MAEVGEVLAGESVEYAQDGEFLRQVAAGWLGGCGVGGGWIGWGWVSGGQFTA